MEATHAWIQTNQLLRRQAIVKILDMAKLSLKYKANGEKELTIHRVDATESTGINGTQSCQELGVIKLVMMTDAEEERSKLHADVRSDKSPQQLKEEGGKRF